ncbi:hypothetical protein [Kribbella sp. CA-294648]|uniref:hypothetical protein n=1 Tax=Kribbella sp. CA-294648 TaxID=3239948 RepID=UPI003D8E6F62
MDHTDHVDPGTAALTAVAGQARQIEAINRDIYTLKRKADDAASKATVKNLARSVESLGNTVTSFEDLLDRLTKAGGSGKSNSADSGSGGGDTAVPVRSWLRLPAQDAGAVEAVLSELLPWMESVYLRYATARESLPPCWLWHPEVVEELLWLMDAWTAAYEGDEACNKLVGDWHDRQRPGVSRRVGEYAAGCNVLEHRDNANTRAVVVPLAAEADPFVTWWATARDETGPAPTTEQIRAGRTGLSAVPDTAGGQR